MASQQKSRSRRQVTAAGYAALVKRIHSELSELEFFIKRLTGKSYWNVGKFIHEHLLEHKERAEYGATLYERLAKDVGRDISTLQRSVQFYRTYPIPAAPRELSWEHYKSLITIKDAGERKKLEQKVIQNDWDTKKLREYLSVKRQLAAPEDGDKPIPKLTFTRGKLDTYGIVKDERRSAKGSTHLLDLGFRMHRRVPGLKASSFKEGDFVLLNRERAALKSEKTEAKKEEIFTYRAEVNKVIDGDTLTVYVDFGFNDEPFLIPKLRLKGIDCPEMDTEEGKRAKRFVESRLKDCAFIIVKTYKDRTDKYDRYLADIFYEASRRGAESQARAAGRGISTDEADENTVAREGKYLNQELLDERLAVVY